MSTCSKYVHAQSCCCEQAGSACETLRAQQSTDALTAGAVEFGQPQVMLLPATVLGFHHIQ